MSENEKELSNEEKLIQANAKIEKLINLSKEKQAQLDVLLNDIETEKDKILSAIDEVSKQKIVFESDINDKLEKYDSHFNEITNQVVSFGKSVDEKINLLEESYNKNTKNYESIASTSIEEIKNKIEESDKILFAEQKEFKNYIEDTKQKFKTEYNEVTNMITQYKASSTESITVIQAREKESVASCAKIQKIEADSTVFKTSVDEYINNMTAKSTEITEKIQKFENKTQEIIDENERQTKEIQRQLELATGTGLFHSFDQRKKALTKTQGWWLGGLIVSILVLIGFSVYLVNVLQHIDVAKNNWWIDILLKASLSLPALYLVAFLTDRYTKERRLIEEYAFKSTLSLSLKPYFDMVSSRELEPVEQEFLIKAIENIFATPTDKVYKTKECQNKIDVSHLQDIIDKAVNQKN